MLELLGGTHYDCRRGGGRMDTTDYILVGNGLAAHFQPNLQISATHFIHRANRFCYDTVDTPLTWIYSNHDPLWVTLKRPQIALRAPPVHAQNVEYDDILLLP
eukprot:265198_1